MQQETINQSYNALYEVNKYFVDLNNRCGLTSKEERLRGLLYDAIDAVVSDNRNAMLLLLVNSKNDLVANKATRILSGELSVEDELKYCGSFMQCVLKGDFEGAVKRADQDNYFALTNKTK